MKELYKKSSNHLENLAVRATRWIGSTNSLLIHTFLFILFFMLYFYGVPLDRILLVVTTIVSFEAIYLSIFIQMSVNRQDARLHEVSQDIEEIQEDVEEIQEDVEGIEKDVDEIQQDVEEIQEDVEGIEEDVEEIQEDVEGIEKDVDEIQQDVEEEDKCEDNIMLTRIEGTLAELIKEISDLKKEQKKKSK